jgi:hypothetical protein
MAFNVGIFLVLYVVISTAVPIWLHSDKYGVINWVQCCLSFFLPLNTIICVWEIALGLHIDTIKANYQALRMRWKGKEFGACVEFFSTPIGLRDIFSLRFWTQVWSTYALYDPSYSNKESFGFFVDVSNGFCFLLPSLLFLYAMTFDVSTASLSLPLPFLAAPLSIALPSSARSLGMLGLVKFYVEFHGTCVYFLSFFLNKRYKGFSVAEVGLFVGLSNGLWFVFPIIGMYACVNMIQTDSFAILRT